MLSKESPFDKFKNATNKRLEIVEQQKENYKKEISEVVYTREILKEKFNLDTFLNQMFNSKNLDGFVRLFKVQINDRVKKLIKNTIEGRDLVTDLNDLPEYMARQNPEAISIKSVGTEATFSDSLRVMNKGFVVKLQTPALNTLTPEKDRPDYILSNKCKVVFDMKGQVQGKAININKKAHDRAMEQGLDFYIIGITNSESFDTLDTVTFYLLPLNYFNKYATFVDKGKYSNNPNNHYYSIKLDKIIDHDKVALFTKLEEKLKPKNTPKNNPFKKEKI